MKAKRGIGITVLCTLGTVCLSAGILVGCGEEKHNLVYIEGKSATCTEDGYQSYYVCTDCDKIFSDENGETEVAMSDITIAALGHDMHHHDAATATCTQPGNVEYWTWLARRGRVLCGRSGNDYCCRRSAVTVAHDMTYHAQVNRLRKMKVRSDTMSAVPVISNMPTNGATASLPTRRWSSKKSMKPSTSSHGRILHAGKRFCYRGGKCYRRRPRNRGKCVAERKRIFICTLWPTTMFRRMSSKAITAKSPCI